MEDSELDFVDSSPSDNNHYNLYNNDTPGALNRLTPPATAAAMKSGLRRGWDGL